MFRNTASALGTRLEVCDIPRLHDICEKLTIHQEDAPRVRSPQILRTMGVPWGRRGKSIHRQKPTSRPRPKSAAAPGRATPSRSTRTAREATRISSSALAPMLRRSLAGRGMLLRTDPTIPGPLKCKPKAEKVAKTGVQPPHHLPATQLEAMHRSATRFSIIRGALEAWECLVKTRALRPRWEILSNPAHSRPRLSFLTPMADYHFRINNHSLSIL